MSRTAAAYAYDYTPSTPKGGRPVRREAHTAAAAAAPAVGVRPASTRAHRTLRLETVAVFIVVWAVVVAGALALVSRYAAMATVTYQMADMKRQITVAQEQNEGLERQVAELKRPERVMALATSRLNMVAPKDFQQATSGPLLAAAQETPGTGEKLSQAAQKGSGFGLVGTLDLIGRGLARVLAGPARTEAQGK